MNSSDYQFHLAIKLARKTLKLSEGSNVLGERLELQKAGQESGSALILVKNGGIFRFCATTILQRQTNALIFAIIRCKINQRVRNAESCDSSALYTFQFFNVS